MKTTITSKGNFSKTFRYFKNVLTGNRPLNILEKYGPIGVDALSAATPIETGETAASWSYSTSKKGDFYYLTFYNSNVKDGVNIAFLIQAGHATRFGTYVEGIDYINPALKPIINDIENKVWMEVKNS